MRELEDNISSALNKIDWDFPGSNTFPYSVHTLHTFPGNYIPQIAAYLIQILTKEGDKVYDPFCGSGTTGVEASRLKRFALQSDVNRTGVLIAEGKLLVYHNPQIKEVIVTLINELLLSSFELFRSVRHRINDRHAELIQWFHIDTYGQLSYLWNKIEMCSSYESKVVLEMIFSDTLFACASTAGALTSTGRKRRHHWGWVADNVRPAQPIRHDAIKIFRDKLIHAVDTTSAIKEVPQNNFSVFRCDARNIELNDSSVDHIITSPPYVGMIDYTLANRLHYHWMGWPLAEDREHEIGARFKRNRKTIENDYLSDMKLVAKEFTRVLRDKGYCAIVIGASRRFPHIAYEVIKLFSLYLKKVWGPVERSVSKRRISERRGSDITELICVYQKRI